MCMAERYMCVHSAVSRVGTHYLCYLIKYQQKHIRFRPQNMQVTMTIICNSLLGVEVSR